MSTRNLALASTLAATSILVVLGHGCTAILDIPDEVTGYSWCLDAEPARGLRTDSLSLVDITYAVSDNWTRGCKCYCLADHEIMLEGAAGALVPGSEDALWYDLQVGQLRAAATAACNDRTAALEATYDTIITFDAPTTISCLGSVADEPAYFAQECTQLEDVCPPGAPGGFGTDGYVPGTDASSDTSSDTSSSADSAPATGLDTTAEGTGDGSSTGSSDGTTGSGLRGLDELRGRGAGWGGREMAASRARPRLPSAG